MTSKGEIAAEEFKTKIPGASDKYSWQLYRWLKKHPTATTIWRGSWNSITGVSDDPVLYIGEKRDGVWIHCRQLRNLCCAGQGLEMFAYGAPHDTRNWSDVTDWFWNKYREIGVCAIHGDYAHDFIESGDSRRCKYCGVVEVKKTEMRPVTRWVKEDA